MPGLTQLPVPIARRSLGGVLALFGVAVLAAGCGGKSDTFAPACPQARLVSSGADLTRFRGAGRDPSDMTVNARLTGFKASCQDDSKGVVKARLQAVLMEFTRGPALAGRSVQVPYFIAVADGDRIISEKDYSIPVEFPPNVDRVSLGDDTDGTEVLIPVTPTKSAAAYTIYVSFRLTPEELEYNRHKTGR